MTRHLAHKLSIRDPALFKDDELRAGAWTLEPTNITPASYVVYPEPDMVTRAQKLSGAAENLRIQAVALTTRWKCLRPRSYATTYVMSPKASTSSWAGSPTMPTHSG
ncbi:hypothetical protein [Mycobacteroides abscessus]|uniref:hypothetical protein n=1 Tax=Mycobacteroides abscessus TaxID=36809 RepID=UPI000C26A319|nr:hypothetical protein [Mycobacteroides abscessus]